MKYLLAIIIFCTLTFTCAAQNVGIGIQTPHASAALDVTSSTRGILFPRMSTIARLAINNPAQGLLVYDSTIKQMQYYDGSSWRAIFPDNTGWRTGDPIAPIQGTTPFIPILTENDKRLVFVGGTDIQDLALAGTGWKGGGLIVKGVDYEVGVYDYLTFDGNGIEARRLALGETIKRNLTLNRYNGNVAIGDNGGSHARLEISGSVGASVAMFGADKYGVTISADNPEIGFNYFYNNGTKTIKAGYGGYIGMTPGNGNIYIGNFDGAQSTTNFGAITGASIKMYILQNGNVGIGTTNPTYKLSVNGNIRSKEVVVESNWADYVFKDDYALLSLKETEKFILENKHLPGVPSAKEIQENGLAIGDLQTKMMAKIEELTLHIIELEKQVVALKNRK